MTGELRLMFITDNGRLPVEEELALNQKMMTSCSFLDLTGSYSPGVLLEQRTGNLVSMLSNREPTGTPLYMPGSRGPSGAWTTATSVAVAREV